MRKIVLMMIISLLVFACNKDECGQEKAANEQQTGVDNSAIGENERLIYFTCPMDSHKHIHHSDPGACEDCGMKLVPGVVTTAEKMDYFGCPMLIHSHVRESKAGSCADCGMDLKPMRLVQ